MRNPAVTTKSAFAWAKAKARGPEEPDAAALAVGQRVATAARALGCYLTWEEACRRNNRAWPNSIRQALAVHGRECGLTWAQIAGLLNRVSHTGPWCAWTDYRDGNKRKHTDAILGKVNDAISHGATHAPQAIRTGPSGGQGEQEGADDAA